jgi:hypothetical protein
VAETLLKLLGGAKKAPAPHPQASADVTATFEPPVFILKRGSVRRKKVHGEWVTVVTQPTGLTAKEAAIGGGLAAVVVGGYYAAKALGRGWHDLLEFGQWFNNAAAAAAHDVAKLAQPGVSVVTVSEPALPPGYTYDGAGNIIAPDGSTAGYVGATGALVWKSGYPK